MKLFDWTIKKDGIVDSFTHHWFSLFILTVFVLTVYTAVGVVAVVIAAVVSSVVAFFTHRADVRINDNSK